MRREPWVDYELHEGDVQLPRPDFILVRTTDVGKSFQKRSRFSRVVNVQLRMRST